MFHYALKNIEIEEIRKEVIIKSLKIKSTYAISSKRLLKYILNKIKKVKGNFRQKKIAKKWGFPIRHPMERMAGSGKGRFDLTPWRELEIFAKRCHRLLRRLLGTRQWQCLGREVARIVDFDDCLGDRSVVEMP